MKYTNKERYFQKSLGNITFLSKQIKTLSFPIDLTFLRVKKIFEMLLKIVRIFQKGKT